MDSFMGVVILIGVAAASFLLIAKTIDDRFPKLKFDVRYRGTRKTTIFRKLGNLVIKDDLIGILLNNYAFYGVLPLYDFHLQPNGERVYDAVMRHDFLFAIEHKDKNEKEILKTRPTVVITRDSIVSVAGTNPIIPMSGKLTFAPSVLNPLKMEYTNEHLTERSISTPKAIAVRLVEEQKNNAKFNSNSNPIMAVLISSLPMIIIVLLVCLLLYISFMGLSDNTVKLIEAANTLAEASSKLR